jgi:membrane protease YdiL (CAAX protease family)
MSSTSNRRAVLWFLILAFGLSWTLWGVLWATRLMKTPVASLLIGLGMWGPGIGALLVARLVLRESWRTTTVDRLGKKRYYLWAWFLPTAGTLVAMGLTVALGVARFDPKLTVLNEGIGATGVVLPCPVWVVVVLQLVAALTVAPLINSLFAVGEELGWRGFLLPRLMGSGCTQWQALLLSGAIWGLWHAPVIVQGHNYPDHPYLGVLWMTVFCTLLGVVFGWLQLSSGSVWAPTIAHGALNAIAGLPLVVLTRCDTALGGMLTSVIGWIPLLAFIVWLVWSGRLPVRNASNDTTAEALS